MDKLRTNSDSSLGFYGSVGFWFTGTSRFHDLRGFFSEIYHADDVRYVQMSHSRSRYNTIRGLHYRKQKPQHRIITVIRGIILDVVLDMRPFSPTFGKWYSLELTDYSTNQIHVAPGLAHGFYVYSDWADILYQTSELYDAADEHGIAWDDPDLNVRWPTRTPIISERDRTNPKWCEVCKWLLPERVGT